jgi:hypothetical protein
MRGWSKSSSKAGTKSKMGRVVCSKDDVSAQGDVDEGLWTQNSIEPSEEAMARVEP